MSDIAWHAPAKLLIRDDAGSEMYFEFRQSDTGTLSQLIIKVRAMDAAQRARMVIDAGPQGTFNIAQILAFADRTDFPAA